MDLVNSKSIFESISSIDTQDMSLEFCLKIDYKKMNYKREFQLHSHNTWEFMYFLNGRGQVKFIDDSLDLSLYNMVVYPPNVKHQEIFDFMYDNEVIFLRIKANTGYIYPNYFRVADSEGIFGILFEQIVHEYENKKYQYQQMNDMYIKLIIRHLKRYFFYNYQENFNSVKKAELYIQGHITQNISIKELCSVANVSTSYLNRAFKYRLGITPMNYVAKMKIDVARRLLSTNNYSVGEITSYIGFNDPKYFCKVFKKFTGYSPSKFRKLYASGEYTNPL